ncbi:MAG: VacB/RNase II family 3'-5' exoribonuclease [Phycisphaeraceae bacterium]|nr:MAG: VacB/RNase II family 3'-5' exoribonuclease [Phycisphaeraceae bacterium]
MKKYEKRLLEHLRHEGYTPSRLDLIAADLGIDEDDREDFFEFVRDMATRKVVEIGTTGIVRLPSILDRDEAVNAVYRRTMRGFGFATPTEHVREGAIFIAEDDAGDALTGDTVLIKVWRDRGRERGGAGGPQVAGSVVEVVKRKRSAFSGELTKKGGTWLVYPDGRELTAPIVVKDAEAKNAREGMKVVVEIVAYPGPNLPAEGVITRVLGEAGRPDVETQATIAAFDLPGEFPESCHEQAREATSRYEEEIAEYAKAGASSLVDRADLSGDFIITIDPPDAKDYDDAISIRKSESLPGGWELGVHIADVSHFVPPGSPIDEEAKDRCNSVYLPRLVIPMIPEVLSNGICSLQEGVHRFCKSAFMTYDKTGVCRSEGVGNTLIKSVKRLTYLEAQALIDGDVQEARRHAKTTPRYTDELIETLREMDACARAIQGRRKRQGMISLELPDVVLKFDEQGRVIDAEKEDDAYTHTLIEMFMVEANEVVARLAERLGVPMLRRVHPDPTPGDVDELRKTANVAGFKIPQKPTREELQGLLDATRGTPASRAVHMAVLRTLTKAEYSPLTIGHFALASEAYAHFTSPIRRYADLTVHRVIGEYLRMTSNGAARPRSDEDRKRLGRDLRDSDLCPDEGELTEIGRHASMREKNAEDAEQSLKKFLVLQLLEGHVGETYAGVVTGVNPKGVFVQIDKYLIDGFVKREDLPGDVTRDNISPVWKIDSRSGALVDIKSGRSFNSGDSVTVKIANVDLPRRQLDLVIENAGARAAGKRKGLLDAPAGGGLEARGAGGFRDLDTSTGAQRRSRKSKSRDQRKPDWRRDKK